MLPDTWPHNLCDDAICCKVPVPNLNLPIFLRKTATFKDQYFQLYGMY